MTEEPLVSVNTVMTWAVGVCAVVAHVLGWLFPSVHMLGTSAVVLTAAASTLAVRGWDCRVCRLIRITSGLERLEHSALPEPENLRRI